MESEVKKMKKFLALLLCVITLVSFSACGTNEYKDADGNVITDDSKILNVMVWNSGYGTNWIYAVKDAYLKEHKGVAIDIVAKAGDSGTGEIYNTIESGVNANDTDLYFAYGPKYLQYVTGKYSNNKLLAALNEVVNYKAPGESKTIGEKFGSATLDALVYEGEYYSLTYESGARGIVYNAELFDKYGLDVPRTTGELADLVAYIKLLPDKKYSGNTPGPGNTPYSALIHYPGYWQDAVISWWLQYEGRDNFGSYFDFSKFTIDELKNMSGYQNKYQQEGIRRGLQALYDIITPDGITYAGSNSLDFTTIQSRFLENDAALMYPCGGWLETEMLKAEDFDASLMNKFKIMKYPVLSNVKNKLSEGHRKESDLIAVIDYVDGNASRPSWATDNDVDIVRFARNCSTTQVASATTIVPSYANAKDLAIDFLKFLYSDKGLKIFAESQKCFMSIDFDNETIKTSIDTSNWSSFAKSVKDISADRSMYVPQNLNHPLYFKTKLQEVFTHAPERMFTIQDKQTVTEFLNAEWNELMKNWATYMQTAGLN